MSKSSMFPKRRRPDVSLKPAKNSKSEASTYGLAHDAFSKTKSGKKNSGDAKPDAEKLKSALKGNHAARYDVGYAKPPEEYRFPPGVSGNPYGRPRGARNKPKTDKQAMSLRDLVLTESNREIPVGEGGGKSSITVMTAIVKSVHASAVKGDPRAQKLALQLHEKAEASQEAERRMIYEAAVEYKLGWEREEARYKKMGVDLSGQMPERPIPDPNHIHIDHTTGLVEIRGPLSADEIPKYQWLEKQKNKCLQAIEDIVAKIGKASNEAEHKKLWREFNRLNTHLGKLNHLLGDWPSK